MTDTQLNKMIRMARLSARSLEGKLEETEKAELDAWLAEDSRHRTLFDEMNSDAQRIRLVEEFRAIDVDVAMDQGRQYLKISERVASRKERIRVWAAAALILILIGSGLLYFVGWRPGPGLSSLSQVTPLRDIPPGGTKATLVLSNGSQVRLAGNQDSVFSLGKYIRIHQQNGLLAYKASGNADWTTAYNELITPKGGTYQLVLNDGTRVWLNAASSIRYPVRFSGPDRTVSITGEAYFEVAEDNRHPFRVLVNGLKIDVLGTHFNVMAYHDDGLTKVTLLEGSIRVGEHGRSRTLKPGQQARVDPEGGINLLEGLNVNQVVAWKNNLFGFEDAPVYVIARQIERWYNVQVEVKGPIRDHFTGSIPRNVSVSKVFEVLQKTGRIHYQIENGKIIVSP